MAARRHPTWVYEQGEEPDYRFSLANERTFLAWIRTSLGLIGGGVAVQAFDVASPGLRALLATVLVSLGGLSGLAASIRWARIERALRTRAPLPASSLTWVAGLAVFVVSAVVLLAV